jgi:hypothetical protein
MAVVRDGADLALKWVLQPNKVHATDKAGPAQTWVPFRPADGSQEWNASIQGRVPRDTHAVRLLDPNILGIVDDGITYRAPEPVAK